MNIIHRNLFAKLRIDNFSTKESLEPMSKFKMKKLMGLMKNIAEMPAGEVTMSNPVLKSRLKNIQEEKLTPTEERFLLDIFRVEFLLRNSMCMRAFHHDLINRLYRSVYNKELPPEEFLRFRPSLYSTSLALYLLETSTVINKDDLKAFDIYSGNISDKVSTFSLEDEDSDGLNNCILALRKLLLNSFNHTYSSEVSIHDLCATHLLTHITNKASHYLKASYGVGEDILKDDKLLWKNLEEMINNFQSYGKKLKETEF